MSPKAHLRRHGIRLASAVLIGGMVSLCPKAGAADAPAKPSANAVQPAKPMALPAGFEITGENADSGVKSALVKLTERSVAKGDFHSFLRELTKQDKERAREYKGADQAKLDAIVEQIQKQWKAKYNEDFSISDKNLVFDQRFAIVPGKVTDPAVALNNWPVPAVMTENAVTAGSHSDAKTEKKEEKAADLTMGREVALVRFPASHALPEMNVSMIRYMLGFWHIDVPNDRSGEEIYNDLTTHFTYIRDHEAQWPSTVGDGYRMMAHHAVAALYGVPTSESKG